MGGPGHPRMAWVRDWPRTQPISTACVDVQLAQNSFLVRGPGGARRRGRAAGLARPHDVGPTLPYQKRNALPGAARERGGGGRRWYYRGINGCGVLLLVWVSGWTG